jgi:glycosyltransferase involved in cell wall biosynthesis
MKIAIVHDYLCGVGGSERVFQYICEEFPEADAYVLAYNPDRTLSFFKSRHIHTTWLNRFVQSMEAFRWSFPFATHVMESLDLSEYEVVLSSSATVAKYVKVPNGRHICYCYIPTRALWQTSDYFGKSFKSKLIGPFLSYLKKHDIQAAHRVDHFIAISKTTQDHIMTTYGRESTVIFSPVDLDRFTSCDDRGSHYLIVSRLEQWKRVDYAIEAFNRLGLPLRVIGTGVEEAKLRAVAGQNIVFLGGVDDATLALEYAKAKAVVFTPFLEYGLIPLEANACGTPVICYGRGGITETMIPWSESAEKSGSPTAVFFYEQCAEALVNAVKQFEQVNFDSNQLIQHASRWGVPEFKRQLRDVVKTAMVGNP